ncbi:hypothetical protein [Caudoviricetes sp.]|nr:hypothetical protein [Caudoviricetes sp.]
MNTITLATKLNSNVSPTRGRFTLTRQAYINTLPSDAQVYANEDGVVIYKYTSRKGYLSLMAFIGRTNSPSLHKSYLSEEDCKKAFGNIIENVRNRSIRKNESKARQIQPSTLIVGDILVSSWGYEQTNVDFYQVTKIIGKRTVEIREIATSSEYVSGMSTMSDYAMPVKDSFISGPEKKVVTNGSTISFSSYRSAYKWDGRKQYRSWYA